MIHHKEYLGDSVYADFDGFMVIIATEDGDGEPGNTIALEPEVIAALNNYVQRLKQTTPATAAEQEKEI